MIPITQETINEMMVFTGQGKRDVKSPLKKCPECSHSYCGDGVSLCLECEAARKASQ